MQEQEKVQYMPVKVYRTADRLMVAAPMPGMEPDDIAVEVTQDGRLIMHGELRGLLKDVKQLLIDEWSVGHYHRELALPNAVNGTHANLSYGNGILVIALPLSERTTSALLSMEKTGAARGERAGNAGHTL